MSETHLDDPLEIQPTRPESLAAIRLLQGVVYTSDEKPWEQVLTYRSVLEDYFSRLQLVLVIDEADGLAYLRQYSDDERDAAGEALPRLFRRMPLTCDVTLLCVLLRDELRRAEDEEIDSDRCTVTVAQVLYPRGDGAIDKVFLMAEGDRTSAGDLGDLTKSDGIITTLKARGFRATKVFNEYHNWFVRRTRVKPLAIDMFNQTVAVKDIRSLNAFIRNHMLESSGGPERVKKLIEHFSELRTAHRQLLRIQIQESELPFAAELIAVQPSQQAWASSIEMVLRSFALSLLVPDRLYRRVSGYLETTRLVDGRQRGQRLVYLRVATRADAVTARDRLHEDSLLRKLNFREGPPCCRGFVSRLSRDWITSAAKRWSNFAKRHVWP